MRNTYLSRFYWKLKQRRGVKKAIIALARKILVIIYNLLKNNEVYNEGKFEAAKLKQDAMNHKKLLNAAKKMGYDLVPASVALIS